MADDLIDKFGDMLRKGAEHIKNILTHEIVDLIRAVDQNDPIEVEALLKAGVNPNDMDGLGRLSLPRAVDNNNLEIVRLLLQAGADPNKSDLNGDLPLHKAVYWENHEITIALLKAGANPELADKEGYNAVERARIYGYQGVLQLLKGQRDVQRKRQKRADAETHQRLKSKAEEARRQQEAAQQAQKQQEAEKLQGDTLLEKLYEAIKKSALDMVQVIVPQVSNIDAILPEQNLTPLAFAIHQNEIDIAEFLLESQANPFIWMTDTGRNPLTMAVQSKRYKLVRHMLEQNPAVAPEALNDDRYYLSPQFIAYDDPRMLNLLLKAGADPWYGGRFGSAMLIKAIEKASLGVLPVLTRHQVDLETRVDGHTALEWAIHFNRPDWVNGLIEEGVKIDTQTPDGRTPLMMAVIKNHKALVQLLLDEGANRTLVNHEGMNALDFARLMGDREDIILMLDEW